jgi:hypothetical protein
MLKKDAKKIKAGDVLLCTHDRQEYTVEKVLNEHPDPRVQLPLFVMTNGDSITYGLLAFRKP